MRTASILSAALLPVLLGAHLASAQGGAVAADKAPTATEKKAIDFLVSKQEPTGAWMPQVGPAVTAMIVRGLVQSGKPATDPAVQKGLAFIETLKQKDGGYYRDTNPNYNSAIVLSMFVAM